MIGAIQTPMLWRNLRPDQDPKALLAVEGGQLVASSGILERYA